MKRILLIDDEPDIIEYLKYHLLNNLNVEVESYQDGHLALTPMLKRNFDLILTDLRMRELDGASFIQFATSHPLTCDIPVIVITGMVMDQKSKEELKRLKVCHVLQKPISTTNLKSFIENILGDSIYEKQSDKTLQSL